MVSPEMVADWKPQPRTMVEMIGLGLNSRLLLQYMAVPTPHRTTQHLQQHTPALTT
jgi:hypothetical protein